MKQATQRLTALLFCLFIAGFGVLHVVLPDRTFSEVENRYLAQFPTFSWDKLKDGTYTAGIETYLEDQFPFRDGWMGLKTRYEWLLGKREFNNVYLCGDRLISKVTKSDRADKNLTYLQQLTEKTDLPVYLGLIPTAAEILRGELPEGAPTMDQLSYIEEAKDSGAIYVDMAGVLADHAGEDIFYRTDHHWTSLGAYYGYTALMEAMGVTPEPLGEAVTVSEDFNGTLYSSSGVHWLTPDTMVRYVDGEGVTVTVNDGMSLSTHGLYVEENLEGKDKYTYFMGGNNPLYIIENPNALTDQKLLVVRDSYSDSLAPFLSQYFSEIHLLDLRYYRTPVAAYAEQNGMDAIFVCYSVDNFQSDTDVVYLGQ